jgi:hypothetical protein
MSQAIHQPAHRDLLHPGANQGYALPGKKETVISITQCPENQLQTFRTGGSCYVQDHIFKSKVPLHAK